MEIPAGIMGLQAKQESGTQSPPSSAEPSDAPNSAPMANPSEKKGNAAVGNAKVRLATTVLGQALIAFGPDSDEAKQVEEILHSLSTKFGGKPDPELVPAQILDLVRSEPSLQKGQPIQQAMQQAGSGMQQQQPGMAEMMKGIQNG